MSKLHHHLQDLITMPWETFKEHNPFNEHTPRGLITQLACDIVRQRYHGAGAIPPSVLDHACAVFYSADQAERINQIQEWCAGNAPHGSTHSAEWALWCALNTLRSDIPHILMLNWVIEHCYDRVSLDWIWHRTKGLAEFWMIAGERVNMLLSTDSSSDVYKFDGLGTLTTKPGEDSGLNDDDDPCIEEEATLAHCRILGMGYSMVVVRYSGGHDSGGVQSIETTSFSDEPADASYLNTYIRPKSWDSESRQHVYPSEAEAQRWIQDILGQPVYDHYSWGFNNEPMVDGIVTWDPVRLEWVMEGTDEYTDENSWDEEREEYTATRSEGVYGYHDGLDVLKLGENWWRPDAEEEGV